MKTKMTFKAMKNSANVVLGVPYCDLQRLLSNEEPVGYATRAEGWACDLYQIAAGYAIVTGYSYSKAITHRMTLEQSKELRELENNCGELTKAEKHDVLMGFLTKHFA